MRKIAYLIPEFPGQTHIFFWREIKALENLGYDISVISTRLPSRRLIAHDWSATAIARTIYLSPLPIERFVRGLSRLRATPVRELLGDCRREGRAAVVHAAPCIPFAADLAERCRELGIGHVHAHSCGRSAMIIALAARMGGPSYSLTLHGPLEDYGPLQRFKWRKAAFGTVITRRLAETLRSRIGNDLPPRLAVQPMGVDTEKFRRDAPYAPWRPGERLRLFSCARLNFVKGHQTAIEACRLLRDSGLDVTLDIAGEDDDGGTGFRKVLEGQIADAGLEAHVRLLGAVKEERVIEGLCAAHLFVLASHHEPLGVAYMEAMSCETPTIGTEAGGVTELITSGFDGLLVPPQRPDLLAATIRNAALSPERLSELARRGRSTILDRFRSSLGAETMSDLLSSTGPR